MVSGDVTVRVHLRLGRSSPPTAREGVWGEGSLIALLKGGNEGSERMSGARTEARTNTLSLLTEAEGGLV